MSEKLDTSVEGVVFNQLILTTIDFTAMKIPASNVASFKSLEAMKSQLGAILAGIGAAIAPTLLVSCATEDAAIFAQAFSTDFAPAFAQEVAESNAMAQQLESGTYSSGISNNSGYTPVTEYNPTGSNLVEAAARVTNGESATSPTTTGGGANRFAAKAPTANEMRSFSASATGKTREDALANLHRNHNQKRQQDSTVTELTNIQVNSSVMKGPEMVTMQGGRVVEISKPAWERTDWYAGGEYRMGVSKPQSASRQ